MTWVWHLGGLTTPELARRVYSQFWAHNVMDRAAALSYYLLLALFPLLIFLSSVLGAYFLSDFHLYQKMLDYLARLMPPMAYSLVSSTMNEVIKAAGGGKLSFGFLLALWTASAGTSAIIDGLNAAYAVTDPRPWWRVRLRAITLTVVTALLALTALGLIVSGDSILQWLGWEWSPGQAVAQWLVIGLFLLTALIVTYRHGPNLKQQRWQALVPGSLVALGTWLLISLILRIYLRFFNTYSHTYGSLGAVIVLLLWLYLTGIAILLGAEVNSEIEHAAAAAGAAEAKAPGEVEPGVVDEAAATDPERSGT